MTKKEMKARDLRIERAYRRSCSGVAINVMSIGKVFKEGYRLIDAGADDAALETGLRAFVDTLVATE